MKSVIVLLAVIACAMAHGGIFYPEARVVCSLNSTLNSCGLTTYPCGTTNTGPVAQFDVGAAIDVLFTQKVSHFNAANTYQLNIIEANGNIEQVYTAAQTNAGDNVLLTFPITLPADVKGKATLQSVYVTTSGTYYSCADLQVGPSAGSSLAINFALFALVALAYFL